MENGMENDLKLDKDAIFFHGKWHKMTTKTNDHGENIRALLGPFCWVKQRLEREPQKYSAQWQKATVVLKAGKVKKGS